MNSIVSVVISKHTTSSNPRPHVVYIVNVVHVDGSAYEVQRRYSEFVALRASLGGGSFPLPPKRIITTSLVPSAWVDDELIKERKAGLQMYLTDLLHDLKLRNHLELVRFLAPSVDFMDVEGSGASPAMVSKGTPVSRPTLNDEDTHKPISATYYPAWASGTLAPSDIDFSKFDVIFFAFAIPNGTAGINWDDGSQDTLKDLVSCARKSGHGTKIVLSVGGWSGSHWFSQAMSTSINRNKLVKALSETVDAYHLDGIDIDWEYPNAPGDGNPHSSADAANFLSFIKMLRSELGSSRIISAAVTHLPWIGEDGSPLSDVSEYAAHMTYVNIMNYDVFSSSSHPGPNAPQGDLCGTSKQPKATAEAALAQWTRAGMPASKLLLGLAIYGYVSKSTDKNLSGSSIPPELPPQAAAGAHPRYPPKRPKIRGALGDLSALWGQQIAFSQLVTSGAICKTGDGSYDGANGYTMGWDDCSNTPYLFNTGRTTVVSYDDTWSIASKTQFARKSRMGGCFTWSLDQDDGLSLHNVMVRNLGK
ncbi:glycoside hydrolase family 18 protein [Hebeloma cylindrosporum]|uniref:Glycoside hydrolase family 18 protein n=1 Tax=Hebeloma cylindrosporum TaxID=76867 RepID=A0A0C3BMF0_HEBCY|nr:glycoside hydrolase family 18 protein [Hebeloma cylindrosporum h7]